MFFISCIFVSAKESLMRFKILVSFITLLYAQRCYIDVDTLVVSIYDTLMKRAYGVVGPDGCIVPTCALEITGPASFCEGEEVVYLASGCSDVFYLWSVPQDWLIIEGQGKAGLKVIAGSSGGVISVTPCNACGCGKTTMLFVKPDKQKSMCTAIGEGPINEQLTVAPAADGGWFVTGYTRASRKKNFFRKERGVDVYVVKLDSIGNLEWGCSFDHTRWDEAYAAVQTIDGGCAVVGYTFSEIERNDLLADLIIALVNLFAEFLGAPKISEHELFKDLYVAKIDSAGILQWDYDIYRSDINEGFAIIQTKDSGYAIVGGAYVSGRSKDVYVVKLDAKGIEEWEKTIGGESTDEGYAIIQTSDGGYAITGITHSFGNGQGAVYVIKLDSVGNVQWSKTIGGKYGNKGWAIIQSKDGGYAITGYTYPSGDQLIRDVYVIKLDAKGNLQWSTSFGGVYIDEGRAIIQTSDGGFAIVGTTTSSDYFDADIYIAKLDALGNLQWMQIAGTDNWDEGRAIVETSDGGYRVAGVNEEVFENSRKWKNVYLLKLSAEGNIEWTKLVSLERRDIGYDFTQDTEGRYVIVGATKYFEQGESDVYLLNVDTEGKVYWSRAIGATGNEEGYAIIPANEGYAIVGYTESFGQGNRDVYLIKVSSKGYLQWARAIGGKASDEGYAIVQALDGGYVIAGYTESFGQGKKDVYIIKVDHRGIIQWSRTIGGPEEDAAKALISTFDGGYLAVGYTQSFGRGKADVYVVKLDAAGNLQWTRTIGGKDWDEGCAVVQTPDSGYIITGITQSFGYGGADVYIIKLDAEGNLQWNKVIGGVYDDGGYAITQTQDGNYAIVGYTQSFGKGWEDAYIIKLDAEGNLQWTKVIGGESSDYGYAIDHVSDDVYVIVGYTESLGWKGQNVYLVQLFGDDPWFCCKGGCGVDTGGVLIAVKGAVGTGGKTASGGVVSSADRSAWPETLPEVFICH